MTKVERISEFLRSNHLRICAAESFTGGGLASAFIALPGASDIFTLSLVSYAEEAKKKLLGVTEQTLGNFGAVSSETISQMLDGLSRIGLGDVFVATSGNAGPTSERAGEVGLFYIGVMFKGIKTIKKYQFAGDRSFVISHGVEKALDLIAEILQL